MPHISRLRVCFLCLFVWSQCFNSLFSQIGGEEVYARRSISLVGVDNNLNATYQGYLKTAWQGYMKGVGDRYDYNPLLNPFIQPLDTGRQALSQALSTADIPEELIAYWWDRQPDGSFKLDRVADRGLYDATDQDVNLASQGVRGLDAVRDQGERLIGNSMVVVFSFKDVQTYQEIYDAQDQRKRELARSNGTTFEPVSRSYRGFKGIVDINILQLDYSAQVQDDFYGKLWINADDDPLTKTKRQAEFEAYPFALKPYKSMSAKVEGRETIKEKSSSQDEGTLSGLIGTLANTGPKTMESLFAEMVNDAKTKAMGMLKREFAVATALVNTKPLQAKIGMKEGLHIDTRYFVYEYREVNGERVKKRVGVVRADKNIADNRRRARGNTKPSTFYKITGKRLDPGMLMEEHDDIGFEVHGFGGDFFEIGGGGIRAGYNISKFFQGSFPTQFYITGMLEFEGGEYNSPFFVTDEFSFSRFGFGVRKDHYLIPFVRVGAGLDIGNEVASPEGNDDVDYNAWFGSPRVEFGIHVWHNVQLVATANYYVWVSSVKDQDDREITDSWTDVFPGRNGASISFGVKADF